VLKTASPSLRTCLTDGRSVIKLLVPYVSSFCFTLGSQMAMPCVNFVVVEHRQVGKNKLSLYCIVSILQNTDGVPREIVE
jgi:hypothetical protein